MEKAERLNKILRDWITKHQKSDKPLNWIDILPNIVENYNNTVHSSIDLVSKNVSTASREV